MVPGIGHGYGMAWQPGRLRYGDIGRSAHGPVRGTWASEPRPIAQTVLGSLLILLLVLVGLAYAAQRRGHVVIRVTVASPSPAATPSAPPGR